MHLLIPFASGASEAAAHVLRDLALPHLTQLLGRLTLAHRDDGDAYSMSPPHERALAAAHRWRGEDGLWPFAAQAAARDGVPVGDAPWAFVTPCHWLVGRDHITLLDPAMLQLDEDDARAAFDVVRGLFESDGFRLEWGGPLRWYAAHDSFADLHTASLDRAIGRNVELWLRGDAVQAAPLKHVRRLQSEFQLLLYPHALNDAREQRGVPTLNSFWLSGCGRHQPDAAPAPTVDDRLRAPLLAEDWVAWADAWRALDAGPIAALLEAARAPQHRIALTLCGERHAHRFEAAPRSALQALRARFDRVDAHAVLEAL